MRKGITLVELLTVTVLIGIFVSMSISTYRSSRLKSELNDATLLVEAAFNTIITNALSGVKAANLLPVDYGLNFAEGASNLTLFTETAPEYALFPIEGHDYLFNTQAGETSNLINLPNSITISKIIATSDGTTWVAEVEGQDLNTFDLVTLLPRAELRLRTNKTATADASQTELAVCLELSSDLETQSLIFEQNTTKLSITKEPCPATT